MVHSFPLDEGYAMRLDAEDGNKVLRLEGVLGAQEADRAAEMVQSVAPFSLAIVDFTAVHDCQDAPFLRLIRALKQLVDITVELRGMTHRQARLLRCPGHRGP